jgi:hypothetical protein
MVFGIEGPVPELPDETVVHAGCAYTPLTARLPPLALALGATERP